MVVVVGKPETAESVRELNFRGEFEVCEIVERSIPAIQRQLEQNGEQISHLVFEVLKHLSNFFCLVLPKHS